MLSPQGDNHTTKGNTVSGYISSHMNYKLELDEGDQHGMWSKIDSKCTMIQSIQKCIVAKQ